MDDCTKNLFDVINDCIGILVSMATFYVGYLIYTRGIVEYKNGNRLKRAEFLEKLIQDFKKSSMDIAKDLLDDFIVKGKYQADLPVILRDHKIADVIDPTELDIRASFDELFDFFTKLSYYRRNELITAKELAYFKYYINKIRVDDFGKVNSDNAKEGARTYINTYYFKEDFEIIFSDIMLR
jgi:hypothetical protein